MGQELHYELWALLAAASFSLSLECENFKWTCDQVLIQCMTCETWVIPRSFLPIVLLLLWYKVSLLASLPRCVSVAFTIAPVPRYYVRAFTYSAWREGNWRKAPVGLGRQSCNRRESRATVKLLILQWTPYSATIPKRIPVEDRQRFNCEGL